MWRIDSGLAFVEQTKMDLENRLENLLAQDISIASPDWFVIGRQVPTRWDKRIDLLCLDWLGNLVVLELKRDKTEREIVAQALDDGRPATAQPRRPCVVCQPKNDDRVDRIRPG